MNREATGLAGARHIAYQTLGSTNAKALALARAGEHAPFWVTAQRQTAGRGRRGNLWVSPPGNLYATLLLAGPAPLAAAPQLSFVAVLALHDALAAIAPALGSALAVKWPNDLLLGEAKLAGILIEGESMAALVVAIGIGVNCASHPADTAYPATDLAAAGALVPPAQLLSALGSTMACRVDQWNAGEGFAAIRADWLRRAVGVGRPIKVRLPDCELSGRFEGLDEAGRLLLAGEDGLATVTAGDVFGLGRS